MKKNQLSALIVLSLISANATLASETYYNCIDDKDFAILANKINDKIDNSISADHRKSATIIEKGFEIEKKLGPFRSAFEYTKSTDKSNENSQMEKDLDFLKSNNYLKKMHEPLDNRPAFKATEEQAEVEKIRNERLDLMINAITISARSIYAQEKNKSIINNSDTELKNFLDVKLKLALEDNKNFPEDFIEKHKEAIEKRMDSEFREIQASINNVEEIRISKNAKPIYENELDLYLSLSKSNKPKKSANSDEEFEYDCISVQKTDNRENIEQCVQKVISEQTFLNSLYQVTENIPNETSSTNYLSMKFFQSPGVVKYFHHKKESGSFKMLKTFGEKVPERSKVRSLEDIYIEQITNFNKHYVDKHHFADNMTDVLINMNKIDSARNITPQFPQGVLFFNSVVASNYDDLGCNKNSMIERAKNKPKANNTNIIEVANAKSEESTLAKCASLIKEVFDKGESNAPIAEAALRDYGASSESFNNLRRDLDRTFPQQKMAHYLNLLKYTVNFYIKPDRTDCRNKTPAEACEYAKSIIEPSSGLNALSSIIPDIKNRLGSFHDQVNNIHLQESCKVLLPEMPELKTICSTIKKEQIVLESSAKTRYERGEVPVFENGTWKWKKKTPILGVLGISAMKSAQVVLPTWMNLLGAKADINYQYHRAMYMKQNQYLQQQYIQNWMNAYYSQPQTFTTGYSNIYGTGGVDYTTGFGF